MTFGISDNGFKRPSLHDLMRYLEDKNISQFGDIIQTPQSPLGQWNGITAEILFDVWAVGLGLYQNFDIDSCEGDVLRSWAKLRLIDPSNLSDDEIRKALNGQGVVNDQLLEVVQKIRALDGVQSVYVHMNDSSKLDVYNLDPATLAFCVIGGNDNQIADIIHRNVLVSTYGNKVVTVEREGFARGVSFIRPNTQKINMTINLRKDKTVDYPYEVNLKEFVVTSWNSIRRNGVTPNWLFVRRVIENAYVGIEVYNADVSAEIGLANFGFFDIAEIDATSITVEYSDD